MEKEKCEMEVSTDSQKLNFLSHQRIYLGRILEYGFSILEVIFWRNNPSGEILKEVLPSEVEIRTYLKHVEGF